MTHASVCISHGRLMPSSLLLSYVFLCVLSCPILLSSQWLLNPYLKTNNGRCNIQYDTRDCPKQHRTVKTSQIHIDKHTMSWQDADNTGQDRTQGTYSFTVDSTTDNKLITCLFYTCGKQSHNDHACHVYNVSFINWK